MILNNPRRMLFARNPIKIPMMAIHLKKQFQFNKFWVAVLVAGLFLASTLSGCTSPKNVSPVFGQSSAQDTPRSIYTRMEDAIIYSRIYRKMKADDLVNVSPIDIDVYHGVAYLKGNVENESQKRMAADLTRGVQGVKRVNNLLIVKRSPL